jgi:hypothetical protein
MVAFADLDDNLTWEDEIPECVRSKVYNRCVSAREMASVRAHALRHCCFMLTSVAATGRYMDILPNPETRVHLKILNDDPRTEYVNANFVRGPDGNPKHYLCAMGPKPTTVDQYWRMLWQEKPMAIVMITGIMEKGQAKCERYWPGLADGKTIMAFDDGRIRVVTTKVCWTSHLLWDSTRLVCNTRSALRLPSIPIACAVGSNARWVRPVNDQGSRSRRQRWSLLFRIRALLVQHLARPRCAAQGIKSDVSYSLRCLRSTRHLYRTNGPSCYRSASALTFALRCGACHRYTKDCVGMVQSVNSYVATRNKKLKQKQSLILVHCRWVCLRSWFPFPRLGGSQFLTLSPHPPTALASAAQARTCALTTACISSRQ